MLASLPALAAILCFTQLWRPVLGHCKIVDVAPKLSQPGPRSHGFIVDRHGKYPWHVGQPGDAGADAIFFSPHVEWVPKPRFPCGQLATLPHGVDIPSALSQAEATGVATTASDGSFEALIFQVNRDGGGACTCEYDPSATATTWQRCKTLVNPPGIQGMWQSDRTNHTAKFQMPSSTVCRGGAFRDKCLVRIRCGWKLRFGGCLAIKTPSSPRPLQLKVAGGSSAPSNNLDSLAAQIYNLMRAKGALVPLSGTQRLRKPRAADTSLSLQGSVDTVALKVLQLIQRNHMAVSQKKAAQVVKSLSQSR